MAPALTSAAAPARLLPLREDLALFPGPAGLDGAPSFTLHDPLCNRFYRLGWREFEILSRWDCGNAAEIEQRIAAETTLRVDADDIEQLGRFLFASDLLRATSAEATAHAVKKYDRARIGWGKWLLHNYLFMRIPLLRPDRFLTASYPLIRFLYNRFVAIFFIVIGIAGFYLIARQWDEFFATFVDMFSVKGAIAFAVTLACLKVIHELGHAYTAKRYGCRVPSMGLALLVLVPVLYTDANEAWKLRSRRQRLAIGLAGVTVEFCCAAVAALAWGFLPNGAARSAAFLIATSTWVTTLAINLSPFMRYDGYYVLSDWLEMPNLHARAFALARWWLREKLLGLGDPPPEEFPPRRRRFLIGFAFLTWLYRFSLFIGIAVLVYAFTIKILGVVMAVVEIAFFLVWPVLKEGIVWWQRKGEVRLTPRTAATATGVVALVALVTLPWQSSIEAPAVLKSTQHAGVFVPDFGARVETITVGDGDPVAADAVLVRLTSPDIDFKLAQVRGNIAVLEWQIAARGSDADLLARSTVVEQEYGAALAEQKALTTQKERLDVVAPIGGRAVDLFDGIAPGVWLPAKTRLLSVIDPDGTVVEAYVDEADLDRIAIGNGATFFSEADSLIEVKATVQDIARASTRVLTEPTLASAAGGPITVRPTKQNTLVPDRTLYRVTLIPAAGKIPPDRILRGTVLIQGRAVSLATRAMRVIRAVLVRESGA
jgi:putative peptide zinc metalloprotease protein